MAQQQPQHPFAHLADRYDQLSRPSQQALVDAVRPLTHARLAPLGIRQLAGIDTRQGEELRDVANALEPVLNRLIDLEVERDEARFSPLGDNHHNAAACPYCTPGR